MFGWLAAILILGLGAYGYRKGLETLRPRMAGGSRLHSVPGYHAVYAALMAALPALLIFAFAAILAEPIATQRAVSALPADLASHPFLPDLLQRETLAGTPMEGSMALTQAREDYTGWRNGIRVAGLVLMLLAGLAGLRHALTQIGPGFPARRKVDRLAYGLLWACAAFSVLVTLAIVLSVLFESIRFFREVPMLEFLFGTHWSPQSAGPGDTDKFGAIPLFLGTGFISLIAMLVAAPIGLMSAVYMAEYASPRFRSIAKPALELLAGIPTVVYGYFAIIAVAPALRSFGQGVGLDVASESALAAGLVMGVMIIPFISSLSDDIITAVPNSLREAAYGLGATKSETIRHVVLPSALPGIMGALLLGISRAIGETMIVVMAAGLAANMTWNPLESVTTVTAQIVALLTGDQEFDSAKTLAAFALGLTLFVVTLLLNITALIVVRKYQERYD